MRVANDDAPCSRDGASVLSAPGPRARALQLSEQHVSGSGSGAARGARAGQLAARCAVRGGSGTRPPGGGQVPRCKPRASYVMVKTAEGDVENCSVSRPRSASLRSRTTPAGYRPLALAVVRPDAKVDQRAGHRREPGRGPRDVRGALYAARSLPSSTVTVRDASACPRSWCRGVSLVPTADSELSSTVMVHPALTSRHQIADVSQSIVPSPSFAFRLVEDVSRHRLRRGSEAGHGHEAERATCTRCRAFEHDYARPTWSLVREGLGRGFARSRGGRSRRGRHEDRQERGNPDGHLGGAR